MVQKVYVMEFLIFFLSVPSQFGSKIDSESNVNAQEPKTLEVSPDFRLEELRKRAISNLKL